MNKALIFIIVAILSACASAPSWEGMSESEISEWKNIGVTVEEVSKYAKAGLDATEVKSWLDNKFTQQSDILAWAGAKFTADSAMAWRDVKFTLEDAIAWSKNKFSPQEAMEWKKANFTLSEAESNRSKGLTPVK